LLKRSDVVDILAGLLAESGPEAPAKRVFLSDWELKKLRVPGAKTLRVPKGSIISPLAADWLDFEGIEVIFE